MAEQSTAAKWRPGKTIVTYASRINVQGDQPKDA